MNTFELKTDIHCGSCIKTVAGIFDQDTDIKSWTVDLQSSNKILTITTNYSIEEVINDLKNAGFKAEPK